VSCFFEFLKDCVAYWWGLVYDLVHVSMIHNSSIPSDNLLTPETVFQLQTLADNHEYNLAYNSVSIFWLNLSSLSSCGVSPEEEILTTGNC
jgi:hypothetical protein